jgi:hypothetical protein
LRQRRAKRTRRPRRGRARKTGAMVMSGFTRYPGPFRVPLNQSIIFQLRNVVALSTSGAGGIAAFIPADPSATLGTQLGSVAIFPEWTSINTLFQQVRIKQLEVTLQPQQLDETKGDIVSSMVIGGNLQTALTPSSYNFVADNSDSQEWSPLNDTGGRGRYHAIKWPNNIPYANVTSPAPSSGGNFAGGCCGSIQFFASALPVSSAICTIKIVGTYQFKCRT